jgi:Ca2+-binding RTX toxin-like protein
MEEIQGITVDLNSTDFVMVKETTTNRLLDLIKSVEQMVATNGNDVIYGNNTSAETIWALDGNDRLESRGGNDTLYGGDGDDYIRAGAGLDTSYGGNGTDYLELYDDGLVAGSRNIRLSEPGTIQYSTNSTNGVDGDWTDGYNGNGGINLAYEIEGFGGSSSADALYGNSQSNVLNGYGGNDTIYGFGGADTIRGGDGADIIYGGDGNDTIYGDQNNDIIDAGAGDDTVYGYGLYNSGTPNNDTIDGGTGTNTLNYTGTNNGFVLNMASVDGSGYATVDMSTGAIYDDKVKNFTKIIGSTGNDTITANDSGMYLDGWSGTDNLYGGAGADTIIARATSGEIYDGNGGADTLQLVQNVNLRTITVNDFETLDIQTYTAYLNVSQLAQFQTIKGSGNFYIYGTAGADTFDFTTIDLSGFTGNLYLDAGNGTDTLKLGANQTLNMTDNYYNTFEDFDIGSDSTLNVTALNNSGRSFYAHNKNFDGVDYLNDAQINFIGGTGNDIFYVDYTALRDGKLSVNGGAGTDRVDIRTFTQNVDFTDAGYNDLFSNIESLDIDQASAYNMELSADVLATWIDGANLTLDIANNTQGTKITITDIQGGTDLTNFTVNSSYSVTPADDPSLSFTMAVV